MQWYILYYSTLITLYIDALDLSQSIICFHVILYALLLLMFTCFTVDLGETQFQSSICTKYRAELTNKGTLTLTYEPTVLPSWPVVGHYKLQMIDFY